MVRCIPLVAVWVGLVLATLATRTMLVLNLATLFVIVSSCLGDFDRSFLMMKENAAGIILVPRLASSSNGCRFVLL